MQPTSPPSSDLPSPIDSGSASVWHDRAAQGFNASNFEATDAEIARAEKTLARLAVAAGQAMGAQAGAEAGPSFDDTLLALSHV